MTCILDDESNVIPLGKLQSSGGILGAGDIDSIVNYVPKYTF